MKLKALAAAVALTAVAGTANAGWDSGSGVPFNPVADGNGELLLLAWNDTNSVIQDLGTSYMEFFNNFGNGSYEQSYSLDAAFGGLSGDVSYSIFAANNPLGFADAATVAAAGFMVTTNVAGPSVNSFSYDDVLNKTASGLANNIGDPSAESENNATAAVSGEAAYAGAATTYGALLLDSVAFDVTALAGESLYMWAFQGTDTTTQAAGQWNIDLGQGTLTYSAVPVPAAVWLFASGLLGLGAISRRKKA
ncbi:MAG: VPLPA-CTERM sorting domain-containing protein [Pseudomonadales bacterium]|nr:VPLPA-CTERM sorting domain-containing protein [Pseudomonadales bacterium]